MIAWPFLRFGYRLQALNTELVPTKGPILLAANHSSFMDPVLVAWALRRPVYFLAWKRLFEIPIFGRIIRWEGAIPLDIDRGADKGAYGAALQVLNAGGALCVFPEGGRSPDGRLMTLKSGVLRLSRASGAAIVPARIDGAFDAWPRTRTLPRLRGRIQVHYGQPLAPPPRDISGRRDETRLEELTRQLQPSSGTEHSVEDATVPARSGQIDQTGQA